MYFTCDTTENLNEYPAGYNPHAGIELLTDWTHAPDDQRLAPSVQIASIPPVAAIANGGDPSRPGTPAGSYWVVIHAGQGEQREALLEWWRFEASQTQSGEHRLTADFNFFHVEQIRARYGHNLGLDTYWIMVDLHEPNDPKAFVRASNQNTVQLGPMVEKEHEIRFLQTGDDQVNWFLRVHKPSGGDPKLEVKGLGWIHENTAGDQFLKLSTPQGDRYVPLMTAAEAGL